MIRAVSELVTVLIRRVHSLSVFFTILTGALAVHWLHVVTTCCTQEHPKYVRAVRIIRKIA